MLRALTADARDALIIAWRRQANPISATDGKHPVRAAALLIIVDASQAARTSEQMNAFGYGFVGLMAVSGWLAWRGSHRFVSALIAGLFAPLLALIAFGALIGRAEFETLGHTSPHWLFAGIVVTLAALVGLLP